jgi:transposase
MRDGSLVGSPRGSTKAPKFDPTWSMVPPDEHDCPLSTIVEEQQKRIDALLARAEQQDREIAQLKKALIGPKSERTKMPSVQAALGSEPVSAENRKARRRERALQREQLPTVQIEHRVPDDQRSCPKCGGDTLSALGTGRTTTVYEYVPAKLVRVVHVQEVLRCRCGDHIVTAPGAPKVVEQGRYGASLLAHLVVAKCVDSIPIYRIEKDFNRQGVPISRSTLNDLFHRAAEITSPLSARLLQHIRTRPIVLADETRTRMLNDGSGKPKNGFHWTFVAEDDAGDADVAFVFAPDRSGETPRTVLGGTEGTLLVDAYSGYNSVADVSSRERAACHAHLRRYFHEALATAPIAQQALDLILELYRVEHAAKEQCIVGTTAHLALRKERAGPSRERLRSWLDEQHDQQPPKSPIGTAIRYALSHWDELGRFLEDARIPLDNNASERALRRVALGRKNYLFVGDVDAGRNIAGLYSLVATCEARGINPFEYLADILPRISDHPNSRIDELLPSAWAAAQA